MYTATTFLSQKISPYRPRAGGGGALHPVGSSVKSVLQAVSVVCCCTLSLGGVLHVEDDSGTRPLHLASRWPVWVFRHLALVTASHNGIVLAAVGMAALLCTQALIGKTKLRQIDVLCWVSWVTVSVLNLPPEVLPLSRADLLLGRCLAALSTTLCTLCAHCAPRRTTMRARHGTASPLNRPTLSSRRRSPLQKPLRTLTAAVSEDEEDPESRQEPMDVDDDLFCPPPPPPRQTEPENTAALPDSTQEGGGGGITSRIERLMLCRTAPSSAASIFGSVKEEPSSAASVMSPPPTVTSAAAARARRGQGAPSTVSDWVRSTQHYTADVNSRYNDAQTAASLSRSYVLASPRLQHVNFERYSLDSSANQSSDNSRSSTPQVDSTQPEPKKWRFLTISPQRIIILALALSLVFNVLQWWSVTVAERPPPPLNVRVVTPHNTPTES